MQHFSTRVLMDVWFIINVRACCPRCGLRVSCSDPLPYIWIWIKCVTEIPLNLMNVILHTVYGSYPILFYSAQKILFHFLPCFLEMFQLLQEVSEAQIGACLYGSCPFETPLLYWYLASKPNRFAHRMTLLQTKSVCHRQLVATCSRTASVDLEAKLTCDWPFC